MKALWFLSIRDRFVDLPTQKNISLSLLISFILLIGIVVFGVVRGIKWTIPISASTITAENGFAYTTILPEPGYWPFKNPGDSMDGPYQSKVQLFENDQPLGPAHSVHGSIRSDGQGQFSHWDSVLYFSTSDNSDPRTNSRFYRVTTRATLPAWILGVLVACFLIPLGLTVLQRWLRTGNWVGSPPAGTAATYSKSGNSGAPERGGLAKRKTLLTWIITAGGLVSLFAILFVATLNASTAFAPVEFDSANLQASTAYTPGAGWWLGFAQAGTGEVSVRGQGPESLISVVLPQAGAYRLTVNLTLLPGEPPNEPVQVYLNNIHLGEIQVPLQAKAKRFELSIPAGVAFEGVNRLRFVYPRPTADNQQPNNFLFHSITLRRIFTPADLLVIGQANLYFLWLVVGGGASVLAWQAGQQVGVFGPGWISVWWKHGFFGLGRLLAWFPNLPFIKRVFDLANTVEGAFSTSGWQGSLLRMTGLTLPFIIFAAILNLSVPPAILFASYYSFTTIVIPAGLLLYLVYSRRSWLGTLASLTLTLGLFALPLLALWHHVASHWGAVGGLLPFSDASGYYYGARRLLDGHLLVLLARRPLFFGMLATLLGLTGQNLQVTLAIFVAVNVIACFLLAREIQASHGATAAVVVVLLYFLFYRVEGGSGITMTENLGLPLGMTGFAVLWRGTRERQMVITWLGLGLLTLALMARTGAFFVLPALLLGGAWVFRGQARYSLRFLTGAATAIVLSFGLNLALGKILTDPTSPQTAFSNFSYVLYGLVVGGKGWEQVLVDHPGAREGTEIYALALEAFLAHPMGVVTGSLKMWGDYFSLTNTHAFSFVGADTYSSAIQVACYALSAGGLVQCIRRRREPPYLLLAAATVGHVASIPFVPLMDGGLRLHAATIVIPIALVAITAGELTLIIGRRIGWTGSSGRSDVISQTAAPYHFVEPGAVVIYGLILAVFITIGPLVVYGVSRPPEFAQLACPAGETPIYVRLTPRSYLQIIQDSQDLNGDQVAVPQIQVTNLRKTAGVVGIKNDIDNFIAGNTMMNTYDLKSGRWIWLLAPTNLMPEPTRIVRICGHASADALSKKYGVFYADSVQNVSQIN